MKIRLSLLLVVSAAAALFLSSCNTFVGMGRDFQRLGQGFENTAYGKKF
ncbi:MAG: entericidin [Akkermansiaceae bacterium]|jgi:predicted small secreted protein|nr:entericidin [Akkermansiaceae bacterium]